MTPSASHEAFRRPSWRGRFPVAVPSFRQTSHLQLKRGQANYGSTIWRVARQPGELRVNFAGIRHGTDAKTVQQDISSPGKPNNTGRIPQETWRKSRFVFRVCVLSADSVRS